MNPFNEIQSPIPDLDLNGDFEMWKILDPTDVLNSLFGPTKVLTFPRRNN